MDVKQSSNPESERMGRRRFLESSVLATTGVVGATLLGVGGRFVAGDALKSQNAQWVQIGEVTNFPQGQVHKATYNTRRKDAWRTVEEKGLLYVYSEDGTNYTVISAVCTHLGCNVHSNEESGGFRCPCHDAYFNRNGDVVSGPPRRGLVVVEAKIEAGTLSVLV